MFSQWAVDALKRLTAFFRPNVRLGYPLRFIADLLFAISVFLWFNRRPLSNYNFSFWNQLLYLVQLFKVVYTLRFLVVELVFRELRTFFCFINPVVTKLAIVRRWQTADPCVAKVINLSFFLLFILLNLFLAYCIEWLGREFWAWIRHPRPYRRTTFYIPKPLMFCRRKKRRRRKSSRYRVRSRSRSLSATRPLISFWPRRPPGVRFVPPSPSKACAESQSKIRHIYPEPLPKGFKPFTMRTTRSGKNY